MPIIIIFCAFALYGVLRINNVLTTNKKVYTKLEMEQMTKEMTGKSQVECMKVLSKYKNKKH